MTILRQARMKCYLAGDIESECFKYNKICSGYVARLIGRKMTCAVETPVEAESAAVAVSHDISEKEAIKSYKGVQNVSQVNSLFGGKELQYTPKSEVCPEVVADYAVTTNNVISKVHENVRLANKFADESYLKSMNSGHLRANVSPGDKCLIFRPLAATATKRQPWIGIFDVISTNHFVTKVSDKNGQIQWVHNSHIKKLVPRRPNLASLDFDDDDSVQGVKVLPLPGGTPPAPPPNRMPSAPRRHVSSPKGGRGGRRLFCGSKLGSRKRQATITDLEHHFRNRQPKVPRNSPGGATSGQGGPRRSARSSRPPDRLAYQ